MNKKAIFNLVGKCNSPNTFSEIIGLGYYDGPTTGIAKIESSGEEYRFAMFDWNLDNALVQNGREIRIGGVFDLTIGTCLQVTRVAPRREGSKQRVWAPTVDRFTAGRIENFVNAGTGALLVVVAWTPNWDTVLRAGVWIKEQPLVRFDSILSTVNPLENWFAFLGLEKNGIV